jgi:uncharacterized protein with HEPN domain
MVADAADRLTHIKDAIISIRRLLAGKTRRDVKSDVFVRAALERFFEIVSEASRHIPGEWKQAFGSAVPWRDIANFGNILRHAYEHVDIDVVWSINTQDLDPLERAIDAMLAAHGK